ncbi:dihydrofolate reductase family protein [Deinococcus aquaticus]|uniref:Dihydrofolate reductase family protein n=1 Tax=Deinococcus aquaticus TaxID=328692 RepID=A0ABY7V389_9DEIO|nr:dihydrofolate reductase family protein [Deinococcus aquaticus]WDA59195.1 dihydrofolate reductase family protein [Deinococcus aquaticus]
MRPLIVTEFLSLDGVYEEHSPWRAPYDPDDGPFKRDELFASGALLLGRTTYEDFAAYWPTATGAFADRMNALPKYVATTRPGPLGWNATPLGPDVVADVRALKAQPGGPLLVYGSGTLVQTLLRCGLVNELRLMIFPVVLGRGKRLFGTLENLPLTLLATRELGTGVLLLTYGPAAVPND